MVYKMSFYPALGSGIFFVGLFVAIILFANKRKFYPIMYSVSISLYVFTVGFVIDVFDFSKNATLGMLALSSIIMILAGLYLSRKG